MVEGQRGRVNDFTDLEAWQVARQLRKEIYQIASSFPAEEKFGLTSQMRRAAVSITANLAEGYARFSYQENIQFLRQNRGSAYELRDHLTTALDQSYIFKEKHAELDELAKSVIRLLNGYIRSTRTRREAANTRS